MTASHLPDADVRLRNGVLHLLDWEPELDAAAVGVTATDGVVTLTGFVDSYAAKLAAERVAKRVRGVRAVANDITVRLLVDRTDADIAHDAAQALSLSLTPTGHVQAVVHMGHVTLTGTVEWLLQKQQAESAVRHVRGVLGLHNHIAVTPKTGLQDVRRRIVRALHNHADLEAGQISVTVHDDAVILGGTVNSWLQRDAAERAAGSAPGITRVDNQILVVPLEPHTLEPPDDMC